MKYLMIISERNKKFNTPSSFLKSKSSLLLMIEKIIIQPPLRHPALTRSLNETPFHLSPEQSHGMKNPK